ncbi:hypothetical protein Tco_1468135 [Tanacetum coccineum]
MNSSPHLSIISKCKGKLQSRLNTEIAKPEGAGNGGGGTRKRDYGSSFIGIMRDSSNKHFLRLETWKVLWILLSSLGSSEFIKTTRANLVQEYEVSNKRD